MKTTAYFGGLMRPHVSDDLLAALDAIVPGGLGGSAGHSFSCHVVQGSEQAARLRATLEDHGFRPWRGDDPIRRDHEYLYWLLREYDAQELESFELLQPIPTRYLGRAYAPDEALVLQEPELDEDTQVYGCPPTHRVIVTDATRELLESVHLHGLVFRSVLVQYEEDEELEGEIERAVEWWELSSDIILPPLDAALTLRGADGQAVSAEYRGAWRVADGDHAQGELQYRRAAMENVPEFDLALTCEGSTNTRCLVASNRFFRFCTEHSLPLRWLPVRLSDDVEAR